MSLAHGVFLVFMAIASAHAEATEDAVCAADGQCGAASMSLMQTHLKVSPGRIETLNASAAEPVPPVSTTMKCVTSLTLQFFAIYIALAIARTVRTMSEDASSAPEEILQGAANTMNYAPMCAVLFLATRMRANLLTASEPDKYDLPQPWCKHGMVVVTVSIALATILHLLTGIAKASGREEQTVGNCAMLLDILRYLTLPGLYGGACVVTAGLLTMEQPADLAKTVGAVPVSSATFCTIFLTVQYFVVHLGVQVGGTIEMFSKRAGTPMPIMGKLSLVLETACATVSYCPMLAILFMCADMRATQLNPAGEPQDWARTWFYITVYAVLGQTLVSVAVPMAIDASVSPGELEGELVVKVESTAMLSVLTVVRWLLNAGIYIGMLAVAVSIDTIQAPAGEVTIPLSTTSKCVIMMSFQNILVFFFLWLLITLRDFGVAHLNSMLTIMNAAKETVMFAPMLCVLFLGTRVRALQLTKGNGAPQEWVQNCMYLASMSLLIQIVMVVVTGLVSGKPVSLEPTKDGTSGGNIVGYCTTALQYLCMVFMYGGAVGVMLGLFQMTPENAATAASG